MAGHSHWAGIKHKKGKADKQRSNLFSKLSREITVESRTTEGRIKKLENNNIDIIIYKTFMAAYNKAKILSKKD